MAKIAIMADLHAHNHTSFDTYDDNGSMRFQDCLRALEWGLEYAQEQKCVAFVLAGDVWHVRNRNSIEYLLPVIEKLRVASESIPIYVIAGNHDQLDYERTNIALIGQDVHLVENPRRVRLGGVLCDLYPYRETRHEWQEMIESHTQSYTEKAHFAIAHVAINGAKLGTMEYVPTHGCDPSDFSMYKHVFAGHYHRHQQIEQITYAGCPLQLDRSDRNDKKGMLVYETRLDTVSFVKAPKGLTPEFVTVDYRTGKKHGVKILAKTCKGNFVDLFLPDSYDPDIYEQRCLDAGARAVSVYVEATKKHIPEHVRIDTAQTALLNPIKAVDAYVSAQGVKPKKAARLTKLGKQLMEGT